MDIVAHDPAAAHCPTWCNGRHPHPTRDPRNLNASLYIHNSDPLTPVVGWHVSVRQAVTVHLGGQITRDNPVVVLDEIHTLTPDQARQHVAGVLLAIDHATPQETEMTDAVDVLRFAGLAPESPFDKIRRTDAQGEWWSARELMPMLGYAVWRDFANAVERAKAACENSTGDASSHFADARKVAGSGPAGADFRLTRYAAYLVAMNGDPRKPEIAAAQTYFAVRTRQAETGAAPAESPDVLALAQRLVVEAERADTAERRAQLAEKRAAESGHELRAVQARVLGALGATGVPAMPAHPAPSSTAVAVRPVDHPAVAVIQEWIARCTVPSIGGTRARELYRAFTWWPGSAGITEARFGRTLSALGYPVSKDAHHRYRPLAVA